MSVSIIENSILDTKPFVFEPSPPVAVMEFEPPEEGALDGQPNFKYGDYNFVLESSRDYVKQVLKSVKLSGKHKHVVVDVKVVDLKAGQYPCKPGWHTDCTLDPHHETLPEIHHIFVWGADSRTRFAVSPVEIPMKDPNTFKEIQDAIAEQEPEIYSIPECTLFRYERLNLHAPTPAGRPGKRILIRVTETDLIRPIRKVYDRI